MNIRNKLTLLFTLLFAAILLFLNFFVYLSSAETRKDEYYKRLRQLAITKADLLLDAKVAPDVLQLIYKNADSLFQEEVAIYDTSFNLLYHDAVDIDKVKETQAMIDEIKEKGEIQFKIGQLQAVGFLYHYKGADYIITTAAKDEYGLTKLKDLKYVLLISSIVSLLLTVIAGRLFAKRALKPVTEMVNKVEEITATSLDLRVNTENPKDEIGELADTFNLMLNRLENSFDSQKQFVSAISHELRTPLSTIITELELSQFKERTISEYKQVIELALTDARKLVRLSNSLLDLAKASYDQAEISFKKIRLDEILLDARSQIIHDHNQYKVTIVFEKETDNERDITINGNEYLLRVAFINLIENACKFSQNHQCTIDISFSEGHTVLSFSDTGVGITEEDIPFLFTPFYRGKNNYFTDGNGIGLSLTEKIVLMHQGSISIKSIVDQGTTFTINFPHI
jgi:signal transduction histidine kinase